MPTDYGIRSSSPGVPCYYTPPGGDLWKVFDVALLADGAISRSDGHHRPVREPTHRIFLARDGRQRMVAFGADRADRDSAVEVLHRQFTASTSSDTRF